MIMIIIIIIFDFARGSQGQHKAKPIDFIFSHIFQLFSMKFDVVMTNLTS